MTDLTLEELEELRIAIDQRMNLLAQILTGTVPGAHGPPATGDLVNTVNAHGEVCGRLSTKVAEARKVAR